MKAVVSGRTAIIQALTVFLLSLPVLGCAYWGWSKHITLEKQLSELEPRYARLQGLLEQQAEMQALQGKLETRLSELAYPAATDVTKAGNDAQQLIRTLLVESKLDVSSIQVLPAKQEGGFDRIPVSLRVEGDITAFHAALLKLSKQAPAVFLDNMTMQTIGAVRPASVQRLGGQLTLTVFRLRA
jgi:general secretion pathway protein M